MEALKKPIAKELKEGETYYDESSKIMFLKFAWGLEPIAYDVEKTYIDGDPQYSGIEIETSKDDLYFLFILFVRKVSDRYNNEGSQLTGFLETFQYGAALNELRNIASMTNKDCVLAISRQGECSCSV